MASAQQASGSAFGESVDLTIDSLLSLVTVSAASGPLPLVSGVTPPNFNTSDSLLGVDVNASIKLLGGLVPATNVDILQTGLLNVSTSGSPGAGAASSASVEELSLELLGSALLPLVLGIEADAVTSEASVTGSCSTSLSAGGSSALVNASLASDLAQLVGIEGGLLASPPPNTVLLDLNLLGGHLRIVLNEQIVTGDGIADRAITVNAIHVTLDDLPIGAVITDTSGEVIISQSTAAMTCSVGDLSITNVGSADPVVVGSPLSYTLIVNNSGPDSAGNVLVEDILPGTVTFDSVSFSQGSCSESAGTLSCNLGDIPNGDFATVVVNVTPNSVGGLSNTATVTSDAADADLSNNSATETTAVISLPGVSADLSVGITESADPVTAGDPLTVTLAVGNAGPDDAAGAQLNYILPENVEVDSVTPSQGSCAVSPTAVTCALGMIPNSGAPTVDVVMSALVPATLEHAVSVTSNVSDPSPGNNSATAQTTVDAIAGVSADLSLINTGSPDPAVADQELTYTLQVANSGPDDAVTVLVTDTLPASASFVSAVASQGSCSHSAGVVTCNLGALANSATATITIVVLPGTPGTVVNTAAVSSAVSDPDSSNNTDTASNEVTSVSPVLAPTRIKPVPVLDHLGLAILSTLLLLVARRYRRTA